MNHLFRDWSAARWLRLVLAGVFLAAAISEGEMLAYVAAAWFGIQAIFGLGCCSMACATPPANRKPDGFVKEVEYEEVH